MYLQNIEIKSELCFHPKFWQEENWEPQLGHPRPGQESRPGQSLDEGSQAREPHFTLRTHCGNMDSMQKALHGGGI